MSLRFRWMVWRGRLRFRVHVLSGELTSLPQRMRRLLRLRRRTRAAAIHCSPDGGGWRICPSGVTREGVGMDQIDEEVRLPAGSTPDAVVTALRAALAGSRYLGADARPMSDRQWREIFGSFLRVDAWQRGGELHLEANERIRRDGSCYTTIEGVAGVVATDAPPEAIFRLLQDLLDRAEERERTA